ncbi:MAG: glutathione S-transferase family protein [Paracoccaceae bacterium]
MLTFYTNPQSRGRIARWMLEETGAPYSEVVLPFGAPMRTPEFLALNPMGKVPVIVHEGRVVTECAAICAYLADAFPDRHLAPPPGVGRAAYYRWLFFAAGPLEAAVTNQALKAAPTDAQKGFVGYRDFDTTLATLEKAVSDAPHVAGDHFSAADVYVGSQIGWGMMFGSLPKSPALSAYWDRLKDRPARLRAAARDEASGERKDG